MSNKSTPTDNSRTAQRARLLTYLQEYFSCTTLQGRELLNILHVAGRVKELRELGHNIVTTWVQDSDYEGRKHRVGKYVLLTSKHKEV